MDKYRHLIESSEYEVMEFDEYTVLCYELLPEVQENNMYPAGSRYAEIRQILSYDYEQSRWIKATEDPCELAGYPMNYYDLKLNNRLGGIQ
jgi:hypothetical protein